MSSEYEHRKALAHSRRIVIKVGTRVLTQRSGRPNVRRMEALVSQIARLKARDKQVVLVSSGAIGAGLEALGLKTRPTSLPDLQMAAAVGQSRLMSRYADLFARKRCTVGQVLLIGDDLKHRTRHLNARNTMLNLLRSGIVPIVNENDVVAVDEIRFGDNDQLAALVTMLVEAEALVLLTTADGFRTPMANGSRTRRVPYLASVGEDELASIWQEDNGLSIGGMKSKLQAAQTVVDVGAAAVIADGRRPDIIDRLFAGDDTGTLIGNVPAPNTGGAKLGNKKRWIAFFKRSEGLLVVDDGAAKAITKKQVSLLPIGIDRVDGQFQVGAMVNVRTRDNRLIARGLVSYSSEELREIKGHRSDDIERLLGIKPSNAVIRRENMVIYTPKFSENDPSSSADSTK